LYRLKRSTHFSLPDPSRLTLNDNLLTMEDHLIPSGQQSRFQIREIARSHGFPSEETDFIDQALEELSMAVDLNRWTLE
jgi:hypothetical protein